MGMLDFLNAGTQMATTFGGMAIQGGQNKRAERRQLAYTKELQDRQVMKQDQMNEQARKTNMTMWKDTNYAAQKQQMQKAGLNVGLMYGMGGGTGGTTGNAGGSAAAGTVQTHAVDAQSGMRDAGMSMMNAAQIALLKAQERNVNADTNNKISGNEGVVADSKGKRIDTDIKEADYRNALERLQHETMQAWQLTNRNATEIGTLSKTQQDKIKQEELKTIEMGLRNKAIETGTELTEAEIAHTKEKISKIVAEIENMKELTEQRKIEVLQKKIQTEFNTSTPAQIKQWTDIGTDVLKATKMGNGKTNIDNRKSYDNSTTNFNE